MTGSGVPATLFEFAGGEPAFLALAAAPTRGACRTRD